MSLLRVAVVVLLAAGPAAARDAADTTPAPSPTTSPTPTPTPTPNPAPARAGRSRQPIRDSAQRQIEAIVREHVDPCGVARRKGVPCFPVAIEREGPRFSVKDNLRSYRPGTGPTPGIPTRAEIHQQMTGAPLSASGGASTDPTCAVKSLRRLFTGNPNTFFLYRTWNDAGQEEALLTDRRLDPGSYATPAVRYELVGEFKGECQAVAAWRSAVRGEAPGQRREPSPGPPPP